MVHSIKRYVQLGIDQIATGVREVNTIVQAVKSVDANTASEVTEGSSIKAIFFEMWLENQSNLGSFILTITKDIEGATGPTFGEMADLFNYTNKKNILYTTQGLTSNDVGGNPVPVLRQWIKIPKSKQRFGLGDGIHMNISNVSANDLNRCGFTTYKEYT